MLGSCPVSQLPCGGWGVLNRLALWLEPEEEGPWLLANHRLILDSSQDLVFSSSPGVKEAGENLISWALNVQDGEKNIKVSECGICLAQDMNGLE